MYNNFGVICSKLNVQSSSLGITSSFNTLFHAAVIDDLSCDIVVFCSIFLPYCGIN